MHAKLHIYVATYYVASFILKFEFSYMSVWYINYPQIEIMEVPTDKVEKASKWTIYCLVDLRVVFIITYVYISVVNLISTTANSEATADTKSMTFFNVTSKPEHINVSISLIDDTVLWSCREHSVTKKYYKGLYCMLIAAFAATLVALLATKLAIFYGSKHGRPSLWQIAVIKALQEEVGHQDSSTKYCKEKANSIACCYKELLTTDYYKKIQEKAALYQTNLLFQILQNDVSPHINCFPTIWNAAIIFVL